MTVSLNGTSGIVFNDASTQNTSAFTGGFAFRNRIINGAMVVNQRASGTLTLSGSDQYPIDRFIASKDSSAVCTAQQNTASLPAGFGYGLLWTTTTGAASSSSQDCIVTHKVEGYNWADLNFGSANAQTFTISFWIKSSITGTYGISLSNSAASRAYMATYSVNSANTWEYKTVTVAGDTTGTWLTTNGIGLRILFDLGSGSARSISASSVWGSSYGTGLTGGIKISETTGATWQVTGVQLEKGSTATSFDYRPYGTELALCQRYFQQLVRGATTNVLGTATWFSATRADGIAFLPVSMRASPSFSVVTGASYYRVYLAGTSYNCSTVSFNGTSADFSRVLYYNNTDFSAMTNGSGWWEGQNANSSIGLTAEL